jgi:hypothetical protein
MSILSVQDAIERINTSSQAFPIAVFVKVVDGVKELDVVAGNTAYTLGRIERGDPALVGVYSDGRGGTYNIGAILADACKA